MVVQFCEEDIRRHYAWLNHNSESEIRIITPNKKVNSIFIHSVEELLDLCKKYSGKNHIFIGINERRIKGTKISDIEIIKNFCIDIDNQKDFLKTQELALRIKRDAVSQGFKEPLLICSGNGFHLYFALEDIPNNEITREKIKIWGKNLKQKYENENCKIDESVFEPARVMRVAGTMNVKLGVNKLCYLKNPEVERVNDSLLTKQILAVKIGEKVDLNKLIPVYLYEGQLDNFFKIFLEEELPPGKINDTLEKNFAIWLKTKKVDLEQVEEIYKKRNWSFGRLKGWIKKVDAGEILEFNIGEIILWIRQYCPERETEFLTPLISYDEETEEENKNYSLKIIKQDKQYNILNQFLVDFDNYAYRQPFSALLSFHCILGQVIKNIFIYKKNKYPIDQRINIFLLRPSGTGKSIGLDFTSSIIKTIGLTQKNISDFTDAGLIGSIDKPDKFGNNITYGIFYDSDFITFDEAETLFEKTSHKEGALRKFNIALNPLNQPSQKIYKRMRWGDLEYYPHFSNYFIAIPFRDFETSIKSGFFQRHLIFIEDEVINERLRCLNEDVDRISFKTSEETRQGLKNNITTNFDYWKKIFENLQKFATTTTFSEEFGLQNYIKEKILKLFAETAKIRNIEIMSIMFSFLARYLDNLYRLSFQSAVVRQSSKIEKIDVDYGFSIIKKTFLSVLYYLEVSTKEVTENMQDIVLTYIYSILAQKSNIRAGELIALVKNKFKKSVPTIYKLINGYVEKGLLSKVDRTHQNKTRERAIFYAKPY